MIKELKKYIEENNLIGKAKESFWIAFDNWKKSDSIRYSKKFHGINEENLELYIHCVGIRAAEWPTCDYNHVTISIRILYEKQELGAYVVWFSLSDESLDDDFLEI